MDWSAKPARKVLGKQNVDKNKKIVIIGAGPTGLSAAETLRDTGYDGLIYMISKEAGNICLIKTYHTIEPYSQR